MAKLTNLAPTFWLVSSVYIWAAALGGQIQVFTPSSLQFLYLLQCSMCAMWLYSCLELHELVCLYLK